MAIILLGGAADTGRAPMAAALLLRLLEKRPHDWVVESCGVLGHDGAVAEVEARDTMVHMGLDIGEHQARSLNDDLAARAALIITLDRGTALVVRARFPSAATRTYSLGELAGRARDIPDPFRMQIGAWMTYAREIEGMLQAAMPRIVELMPAKDEGRTTKAERRTTNDAAQPATDDEAINAAEAQPVAGSADHAGARADAAGRIVQLLQIAAQMPGVIDWAAARARIESDLAPIAAAPQAAADLIAAYAALLRAVLVMLPATPTSGQIAALQRAANRLAQPIGQAELNELSGQIATLPSLT
ncbi:MAG: protein tyrosine phosphatase [Roseiflexaceae bacterium]